MDIDNIDNSSDNDNDNYYYDMLVPPEVLLDVLSFTTGIELSKITTAHRYFKQMIDYYSKSLPDMTIHQLVCQLKYRYS